MKKKYFYLIILLFTLILNNPSYCEAKNPRVKIGGEILKLDILIPEPIVVKNSNELNLKIGDKILGYSINRGKYNQIDYILEFKMKIDELPTNTSIKLKIKRNNEIFIVEASKDKIIDLELLNVLEGLATLTYVCEQNGKFGAMAHSLDPSVKKFEMNRGQISTISKFEINKSKKDYIGHFTNIKTKDSIGDIYDNNQYGISGKIKKNIIKNKKTYEVAQFDEIKKGAAYLVTQDKSLKEKLVEIEIIEIVKSKEKKEKSIKFKLKDQSFLKEAGGIIRGMSGSPIVQNNKIIGAVSHAVPENPIYGYGLYIGNMIK